MLRIADVAQEQLQASETTAADRGPLPPAPTDPTVPTAGDLEQQRIVRGLYAASDPVGLGLVRKQVRSELELALPADAVVLSTGLVPAPGTAELARLLKVPRTQDGFFLEAHLKLRPVEFATDGVFLAGLAHSPGTARETVAQACAAASRAATILAKDRIELDAVVSQVVDENCDGCAYCVDPCPFHALELIEYMRDGEVKRTVDRDLAVCKGCGVCQATCPKGGIVVNNFKLSQLVAMVHAALEA